MPEDSVMRRLALVPVRQRAFWIPKNPATADLFADLDMAKVVAPAIHEGFQGFAPHLVQRFILPGWWEGQPPPQSEAALLQKHSAYITQGLRAYFRLVQMAMHLENYHRTFACAKLKRYVQQDLCLDWQELDCGLGGAPHRVGLSWQSGRRWKLAPSEYRGIERNVLLVALHWGVNVGQVAEAMEYGGPQPTGWPPFSFQAVLESMVAAR